MYITIVYEGIFMIMFVYSPYIQIPVSVCICEIKLALGHLASIQEQAMLFPICKQTFDGLRACMTVFRVDSRVCAT